MRYPHLFDRPILIGAYCVGEQNVNLTPVEKSTSTGLCVKTSLECRLFGGGEELKRYLRRQTPASDATVCQRRRTHKLDSIVRLVCRE